MANRLNRTVTKMASGWWMPSVPAALYLCLAALTVWHTSRAVAFLLLLGAFQQLATANRKRTHPLPPPRPAPELVENDVAAFDAFIEWFEETHTRLSRQSRELDMFGICVLAWTLAILWVEIIVRKTWWFGPPLGGISGVYAVMLIIRRRGMRDMKASHQELLKTQGLLHAMETGRFVVTYHDLAPGEKPPDIDGPPDEIVLDLLRGTAEHGPAVGYTVRTDGGWEIVHAQHADGTEYGPHEPAHDERQL